MINTSIKQSIVLLLGVFCSAKPMQNIYNQKPVTQQNNYAVVNYITPLHATPIKSLAHQLSHVTHSLNTEKETLDFATFWHDINNQNNEILNTQPNTIHHIISEKTFSIQCCGQIYSNIACLRAHIVNQHAVQGKYAALLKDGSFKLYRQSDSATCRTIYEHCRYFFQCPACNQKYYANTKSLKRHYEYCKEQ